MTVLRIMLYFFAEAATSLRRSWKVSVLAVVTIAMSLFIGGAFLLLTGNLSRVVEAWRSEARILVYLESAAAANAMPRIVEYLEGGDWTIAVTSVSEAEAEARFREVFPSVASLVAGWSDEPLPPYLEVEFTPPEPQREGDFAEWLEELERDPAVLVVDDDRDWLRQLGTLVALLRGLGLVVGATLLGGAIFTIASVIRLAAMLYREEIAVMRLVGATELYIRGPFYAEGLLQGLAGGVIAVVALFTGWELLARDGAVSVLGAVLVEEFLPLSALAALLALGAGAGLLGAILSLRREVLDA